MCSSSSLGRPVPSLRGFGGVGVVVGHFVDDLSSAKPDVQVTLRLLLRIQACELYEREILIR